MDVEKYISSGVLELYLAGTLTEEENLEVYQNTMEYPKIKEELLSIEVAILELSKSVFPEISKKRGFDDLKNRIGKVAVAPPPKKRINWSIYGSWAVVVLFAIGLLWFASKVSQLKSDINIIDQQNLVLQHEIGELRDSLEKSNVILNTIKGKNTLVIPLGGQKVSPSSNAKVYWNKEEKKVYIDAQGLPGPPDGFVYQVWSLKLDPITPTSVGLLDDFLEAKNKVFALDHPNIAESEAFGITLEPEGGSETPTLEQLYTLGTVSSSS